MKSLSEILQNKHSNNQSFRQKTRKFSSFDFLELIQKWPDIVGDLLAKHTRPLKLQGPKLVVMTDHPLFAQKLDYLAPEICKKIQKKFPALKKGLRSIQFFHSNQMEGRGKAEAFNRNITNSHKGRLKEIRHLPQYKKAQISAEEMFSFVEDLQIRESLVSLEVQRALG